VRAGVAPLVAENTPENPEEKPPEAAS